MQLLNKAIIQVISSNILDLAVTESWVDIFPLRDVQSNDALIPM